MHNQAQSVPNLKSLLVTLFNQLGLNAQAKNIERSALVDNASYLDAYVLFKKHHVVADLRSIDPEMLSHTIYPFLILPEEGEPQIGRRNQHIFEYLGPHQQWQPLTLPSDGKVFIINSLPSINQKRSRFASQFKQQKKWFKPVFLLSLISSLTGLAIPLFTMAVYDRVIGGQAPDILPGIAIGALLALSIFIASRLLRAKVLASASNKLARDLSAVSFNQLLSMPLMMLSRVGLSNHLARLRNAEKVRGLLSGPSGAGLIDLPFTIVALIAITVLSGWLVLVPLCMLILFYLVMKALNRFTQAASPTISSDYQNSLNELAKNVLELKTAGETEGWYADFIRRCREHCRQQFIYAKRNGLNAAVAHAMGLMTALVTVFCGIFLVLNQSISPGALIACGMLIWRITGPAQLAFSSMPKINMITNTITQFDRFMEVTTEFNQLRLDGPNLNKAPSLSFKHVTLRYTAEAEPALSGVTFDVEAGETVAIIGPNGSGKTTLLLAAIGVIDTQAGFVTLDGKNLKQFDPEALRQWAAFSPTHTELLPGSLADNLRLAKPDATDEELCQALYEAGGDALKEVLGGDLHRSLSAQGANMFSVVGSGYISLARALLKKSPLLVMDEPIANRNPFAKKTFIETLTKLKGKTTILFTSHDQELIQHADKVVILNKGTVVYAGPIPNKPTASDETQLMASMEITLNE